MYKFLEKCKMANIENDASYFSNIITENERTEWVPLSLSLVEYPKGDIFGKLLAISSLAPYGIGSGFITLILFRRDLHTITFFLGTICSEMFNYFLKHTLCEIRPKVRPDDMVEYGMPSSHAQFVWFFTTYVIYFVFIRSTFCGLPRSPKQYLAQALFTVCTMELLYLIEMLNKYSYSN